MFWAQVKAFEPLFALNLRTNDFEAEMGQTNGTLAHSIERLLATVPTQTSGPAAIIN
jgi:lipopolysaccharide biosynthesis protein